MDLEQIATIGTAIFAVGTVTYIFGDMFGFWNKVRLARDRSILKRDSQIVVKGSPYGYYEQFIKGSDRRREEKRAPVIYNN